MTSSHARWVQDDAGVAALAGLVVEPGRERPVACVTTQSFLSRPMLDPDNLAESLGDAGEVWVISHAEHGWKLTEALPTGLDVYGGAIRVWWPMSDLDAVVPREHPVYTIFNPADAERVTAAIVRDVKRRLEPAPAIGDRIDATVTRVSAHGAQFEFGAGFRGFAPSAQLANGTIYNAWEAVREGQRVQAEVVVRPAAGAEIYQLNLRSFAPEPWTRVTEIYRQGMDVEGVVVRLLPGGALVEILPGAAGLLPIGRIAREYVHDISDYVQEEDRVVVHICRIDARAGKADLSLIDVAESAPPEPVASIYPDGPPWLGPVESDPQDSEHPLATTRAFHEEPRIASEAAIEDETMSEPEAATANRTDEEPVSVAPEPHSSDETVEIGDGAELDKFSEALVEGRALRHDISNVVANAERDLDRVREETRAVLAELRAAVDEAQVKVMNLGRDETAAVVTAAQEEISALRAQVDELRDRATADQRERSRLIAGLRSEQARRRSETQRRERAQSGESESRGRADRLQEQLDLIDGGNPVQRLQRELFFAWSEQYTTDDDRRHYPFAEPIIGPAFIDSVQALAGVSRERILQVCAHVVAGRAHEINSLELHPLRTSTASDSAQVTRRDGAIAWRVSLQVKSSSARRLHYWQRPDGRIELSKVGVHDDLSIV